MDTDRSRYKCTTNYYRIVILLGIHILMLIPVAGTTSCTTCKTSTTTFSHKNAIITYGPNDEANCNCQWTIPSSIYTDDNTAVVLLLQNVSLPMTSGSVGSIDCSARIRFPGTSGFRCNFIHNDCLALTTESTICNINKISENIPSSNHTCDSLTSWSKAGGSPSYKILYNAGNFAGYTKYFILQYIVIDCRLPTTTLPFETTSITQTPTSLLTTEKEQTIYSIGHTNKSTLNYTTTTKKAASATTQKTASDPEPRTGNSTTVIIIVAIGTGLLIILIVGLLILKRHRGKSNSYPRNTAQEKNDMAESNLEREMVENSLYGDTMNEHKSETIVNEIYETGPLDNENGAGNEPGLYAVVQKKGRQSNDNNHENAENDEHSDIYAVVNKDGK